VETELVVRGIAAEKVPGDALVCPVGGNRWQPLDAIPPFAKALAQHRRGDAAAMDAESTIIDLPPIPIERGMHDTTRPEPALTIFDDASEQTIVDIAPLPPSEPPPRPQPGQRDLSQFEEFEERTIVEKPRR
jgi:hypothetical protein